MAEKLIFPVGFDLDAAVKEAADAWASKYQAQLEKAIQKKPLNVSLSVDAVKLNNLSDKIEELAKRSGKKVVIPAPETTSFEGAIKRLQDIIKGIDYSELTEDEEKNIKTLTKAVNALSKAYQERNKEADRTDKSQQELRAATAAQKRAKAELDKAKAIEVNSRKEAKLAADISKKTIAEQNAINATKRRITAERNAAAAEQRRITAANNAEASVIRKEIAERRLHNAVNRTTNAYRAQEGYIDRLIKRTAILFSFRQVINFARQLREVTAEFELQRVSLGAIIQDTQKANELFSRIKTFAVQSPFEIKDLVSYVKQLSAYRIATEDLFDTTKRLADVSAGLGVDMQRIILAYGQVRAASVLRGQEVRQFTEAGIPLVELLAEKFTKLRGEIVSTGEVFDLISQRAVSFEMVKEIFEDMTNAGGMFYNMQEKQAKTLAGQWSNLKDAYSIMLDEMGNTKQVRGGLEGIISLTKTLMENWEFIYRLLNEAAVGFVFYKIYGGIKNFVGAFKSGIIGSYNKYHEAVRKATLAENMYNAAMQSGTATQQIAAKSRLNLANATLAAARAEAYSARQTTLLTYAWRKFTAALKANWVLLAISAIVALGEAIANAVRKSNELKNALKDIESEGRVNMEKTVYNFERLADKAVDAADGSKEQRQALEELQRTYKDMIPTHLLTIENLRAMAGNYDKLTRLVREYSQQQMFAQQVDEVIAQTTKKIIKQQDAVREYLEKSHSSLLFGEDTFRLNEYQIADFFSNIEKYAKDTSLTIHDVIRKSLAGIVDDEEDAMLLVRNMNVVRLVQAYKEQNKQLSLLENKQKTATGELGRYNEMLEKTTKNIEDWKDTNDNLKIQSPTIYNDALVKETTAQYEKLLRNIFKRAGVAFQDSFVKNGILDMNSIGNAIIEAGNAFDASATFVFRKMQKTYEEIVPSRATVTNFQNAFREIAGTLKINLDDVKQDMIQSDEVLKDYAERVEKTIKELKSGIQEHELNLASQTLTGSQVASEKSALKRAEDRLSVLEQMYEITKQIGSGKAGGERAGGESQLSILNALASEVDNLHKRYEEYRNYLGDTAAEERVRDVFGTTLDVLRSYGIELPKTTEEYKKAISTIMELMRKEANSGKDVIKMGFKYDDIDFKDQVAKLEKELKRLAEEVSRTKTAKEFFDKMLNMTGDRTLSADITMDVYGIDGGGLKQKIIDQIRAAFSVSSGEELDLSGAINPRTLEINYMKLAQLAEENKDRLLESSKSLRDGLIKAGIDATAKQIEEWEKQIKKEESFDRQRLRLARETASELSKIFIEPSLNDARRESLSKGYEDLQKKKMGEIAWDEFRNSDMYVQIFDNLETTATPVLNSIIEKLNQFKEKWEDALSPNEMREWQRSINELNDAVAQRNPFKALSGAVREYREAAGDRSYRDLLNQYTEGVRKAAETEEEYINALKRAQEAERAVDEARKTYGDNSQEFRDAEAYAKSMWDSAKAAGELAEKTKEERDATGDILNKRKKINKALGSLGSKIGEDIELFNTAANGVKDMLEAFGASDIDMQFFDDIVNGFNKVSQGAQQGIAAVSDFMTGNYFSGIMNSVGAIGSLVSGFGDLFMAGRVQRANKIIEKQQNLIDNLVRAYQKLQDAAEAAFGGQYIQNYNDQISNLQAQIIAKQKQMEAEKSKGSKKDKGKIKEYESDIKDLQDQIEEMQNSISENFLGSSMEDAARSFVDAWLDAYEEFGDTRQAIEESMRDMMRNLVKEAVLGAIAQQALKPLFNYLDTLDTGAFQQEETWKEIDRLQAQGIENMNKGLGVGAKYLEQMGMLTREMGGDLTGISKDIATASEESILGLAAGINTQNFYISGIYTTVMQMYAIMRGGTIDETTTGVSFTDLITVQNQYLSSLPTIAQNTAEIITRAERAAVACEDIAANLNRVIKPVGVKGSYTINSTLS